METQDAMIKRMREQRSAPMNLLKICVDRIEEQEPAGRIYSELSDQVLCFSNCAEILLRADKLFDQCDYPQSFQERRCFEPKEKTSRIGRRPVKRIGEKMIQEQKGALFTFEILVETRRYSGWQGVLADMEGGHFLYRSEVELMREMNALVKRWCGDVAV